MSKSLLLSVIVLFALSLNNFGLCQEISANVPNSSQPGDSEEPSSESNSSSDESEIQKGDFSQNFNSTTNSSYSGEAKNETLNWAEPEIETNGSESNTTNGNETYSNSTTNAPTGSSDNSTEIGKNPSESPPEVTTLEPPEMTESNDENGSNFTTQISVTTSEIGGESNTSTATELFDDKTFFDEGLNGWIINQMWGRYNLSGKEEILGVFPPSLETSDGVVLMTMVRNTLQIF